MASACYAPITLRQGETPTDAVFGLFQDASFTTPVDLTGCTAHLTVRDVATDSVALLDLTSGASQLALNTPSTGLITIPVAACPSSTTAAWTPGLYAYELVVVFADGSCATSHYGPWTVVAANVRTP